MIKLDYYTLLCPEPIQLSIGKIRHPTLRNIGKISFSKFCMYQVYLKLTPKDYYMTLNRKQGEIYWDVLSDEQKKDITLYDIILLEKSVLKIYLEILNFFFVERVVFREDLFILVNTNDYSTNPNDLELNNNNVSGVINSETFLDVLDILQQVCCIKSDDPLDDVKPKFKNEKAKKLYERMLKAKEEKNKIEAKKNYVNLSLPNIISSTSAKVPGLNIINIWDSTLFQLYDQFEKGQNNDSHYMNSVRVAVWGDEKNQFDPSLWYKNNYDKQL